MKNRNRIQYILDPSYSYHFHYAASVEKGLIVPGAEDVEEGLEGNEVIGVHHYANVCIELAEEP